MNFADDHDPDERRFILRVQPERADHPWFASLEYEGHATLGFSSPLELARHLADLERDPLEGTRPGLR
jgi:hypothetical protein